MSKLFRELNHGYSGEVLFKVSVSGWKTIHCTDQGVCRRIVEYIIITRILAGISHCFLMAPVLLLSVGKAYKISHNIYRGF
jgi:hypothetical protein